MVIVSIVELAISGGAVLRLPGASRPGVSVIGGNGEHPPNRRHRGCAKGSSAARGRPLPDSTDCAPELSSGRTRFQRPPRPQRQAAGQRDAAIRHCEWRLTGSSTPCSTRSARLRCSAWTASSSQIAGHSPRTPHHGLDLRLERSLAAAMLGRSRAGGTSPGPSTARR